MTIIQAMGGDATESMVKWLGTSLMTLDSSEGHLRCGDENDIVEPISKRKQRVRVVLNGALKTEQSSPYPSRKAIARKGRRRRAHK